MNRLNKITHYKQIKYEKKKIYLTARIPFNDGSTTSCTAECRTNKWHKVL